MVLFCFNSHEQGTAFCCSANQVYTFNSNRLLGHNVSRILVFVLFLGSLMTGLGLMVLMNCKIFALNFNTESAFCANFSSIGLKNVRIFKVCKVLIYCGLQCF